MNVGLKCYLERRSRQKQRERFLWQLLMLALVGTAAYWIDWKTISLPKLQPKASQNDAAALQQPCDTNLPEHGSTLVLEPSTIRRSDVLYSGLALDNQHRFPIVAIIGAADHSSRYEAVTLYPHQKAEISLPVGSYGLSFMVGSAWCNLDLGFTDGRHVLVSNPVEILQGKTNQFEFQSSGSQATDISLVSTQIAPVASTPLKETAYAPGGGNYISLELHRQANGGFYVNGTINRVPIVFQIDTGASITSIPREVALSAGIYGCDGRMFDTVNGRTFGCLSPAKEITFGSHSLNGFQVAAMPNLKGALLGMNILRHFKIENAGEIMRITPLEGSNVQSSQYQPPMATFQPPSSPPMHAQPSQEGPQPATPDLADTKALGIKTCDQSYEAVKASINARMRQGYSAQEGEWFRERLRQNEEAHHTCLRSVG